MFPDPLPALPPLADDSHKGDRGRVLLIAGSSGMAGAVALAATAALRSGAGYVEIVCPASLLASLTEAVPAAMVHVCGSSSCEQLEAAHIPIMLEYAARAQSVVIGPGLGAVPSEVWLPQLLAELQKQLPALPLLLDADGLNHLAAAHALSTCTANMILTPHPGEAARLLDLPSSAAVQKNRSAIAQVLSEASQAVIVLKGAGTWVAQQGHPQWQNHSGNVGLATAGSGDVLSGHIGALLAGGLSPFEAARLGVYLHGTAADSFAEEWGPDGLTAMDLPLWISKEMKTWRENPVESSQ